MRICVFCGSARGISDAYASAAAATAQRIAQAGHTIVYGGGKVGLMGIVANAALSAGVAVIGVIPRALVDREISHTGLSELHIVASMQERTTMMSEISDAFLALPGGPGTLEEFFEQWTWAQLGMHAKPCALLDVNNYFEGLHLMIVKMASEGFLTPAHARMIICHSSIDEILAAYAEYSPPPAKWTEGRAMGLAEGGARKFPSSE